MFCLPVRNKQHLVVLEASDDAADHKIGSGPVPTVVDSQITTEHALR